MPSFFLPLSVAVLKSRWLRTVANRLSYYDKSLGDEDAITVGTLHTDVPGWAEAQISFIKSSGFQPLKTMRGLQEKKVKTVVVWGENDQVLPKGYKEKFIDAWGKENVKEIEECGHVPHLEKPKLTAEIINEFVAQL